MSVGRSSRPRPRPKFLSSPAALEPRALLSGAAEVAPAAASPGAGPTVSVDAGYYDSYGVYAVNNSDLNFHGEVGSPGARVVVYATPRRGAPIPLGQAEGAADGSWRLHSEVALADGSYTITARATDAATGLAGAPATMASKLNVDNVGPRIVAARLLPRRGRILLAFRDFGGDRNVGSGLFPATARYSRSYAFAPRSAPWPDGSSDPRWEATGVEVSPARRNGVQRVVVTINEGAAIPDGSYRLYIQSPGPEYPGYGLPYPIHIPIWALGVRDQAGNKLDGAATSTIPAPDSNDFATAFVVRGGLAHRVRGLPG